MRNGRVFAVRAPTPTLPRKRERGQVSVRSNSVLDSWAIRRRLNASTLHGALPLPLAGEGWGRRLPGVEVAMDDQKSPMWKVPTRLRSNAKSLRANSTDAERMLWAALRSHRLKNASFRRQVPIANFIADFVCHAAMLVVEFDGGQHYSASNERADAARTSVIESNGFHVLRFSNHDVVTNRSGVLEIIAAALDRSAPSPTLKASARCAARKRERERAAVDAIATPLPNPQSVSLQRGTQMGRGLVRTRGKTQP